MALPQQITCDYAHYVVSGMKPDEAGDAEGALHLRKTASRLLTLAFRPVTRVDHVQDVLDLVTIVNAIIV